VPLARFSRLASPTPGAPFELAKASWRRRPTAGWSTPTQ